jgi:hypothetical protein
MEMDLDLLKAEVLEACNNILQCHPAAVRSGPADELETSQANSISSLVVRIRKAIVIRLHS